MTRYCPECGSKLDTKSLYFCPNDYTRYYVCPKCEHETQIEESYDETVKK